MSFLACFTIGIEIVWNMYILCEPSPVSCSSLRFLHTVGFFIFDTPLHKIWCQVRTCRITKYLISAKQKRFIITKDGLVLNANQDEPV